MLFNTTKQEPYTLPDDAQMLPVELPESDDLVPDNMRVLVERQEQEQDDQLAQPVQARPAGPGM